MSLAGLSVVMSGVSRWVGTIRYTNETDRELVESRPRYSLFSILAVSTAISLVLGLVRLSRASTPADDAPLVVAQMLLSIVAFALNLLATIWATLGAGRAQYRIVAVFVIAILLGFSMSVGVGNSPFAEPWWLFASSSLIVVVPTTIVALTLLYLRKLGFRLIPRNQQSEPEIKPSLWDTPTRL